MMTAEDCRRMAARWLSKTEGAADPKTIANMRRASDAWAALAQQIEQVDVSRPHPAVPVRRPADLASPRNSVKVGDVLRERLRLSNEPSLNPHY